METQFDPGDFLVCECWWFFVILEYNKKVDWFLEALCFQMLQSSEIHLFQWVSGNQRPALGTAVSWDRRLLGKAGLASVLLAVLREAKISAARGGLGMCLALREARKSLSLMSSWHQWMQPAQLYSRCPHQLCLWSLLRYHSGILHQFLRTLPSALGRSPSYQEYKYRAWIQTNLIEVCSIAVVIEGPKQNASFTFGE